MIPFNSQLFEINKRISKKTNIIPRYQHEDFTDEEDSIIRRRLKVQLETRPQICSDYEEEMINISITN